MNRVIKRRNGSVFILSGIIIFSLASPYFDFPSFLYIFLIVFFVIILRGYLKEPKIIFTKDKISFVYLSKHRNRVIRKEDVFKLKLLGRHYSRGKHGNAYEVLVQTRQYKEPIFQTKVILQDRRLKGIVRDFEEWAEYNNLKFTSEDRGWVPKNQL
ncbi:MAG: hypothetical protein GY827_08195 [Cytophagales bacterium]|nr:hypothetical protein [Cytophagales bacterium]